METSNERKMSSYCLMPSSSSSPDSSLKQASDFVVRTTDAVAASFEELRATGKFIYSASRTFKHEIKKEQSQF